MKQLAIIGYGALSKLAIQGIRTCLMDEYTICGVWSRSITRCVEELKAEEIPIYPTLDALLNGDADIVIEIASGQAVRDYGTLVLEHGKDLIITSVGALSDDALRSQLEMTGQKNQRHLYLISGAVGGFDLLRSISLMGKTATTITTEKAPRSLNGAPYLAGQPLPEDQPLEVFVGSVSDAIAGFPKNVNVAVASALAANTLDTMQVHLHSVPGMTSNRHTIRAANDVVSAKIEIEAKPDPSNPRSSTLTAWSIVALLQNLASTIRIW